MIALIGYTFITINLIAAIDAVAATSNLIYYGTKKLRSVRYSCIAAFRLYHQISTYFNFHDANS